MECQYKFIKMKVKDVDFSKLSKRKIRERLEILKEKRDDFTSEICKKMIELDQQIKKIENFFRP